MGKITHIVYIDIKGNNYYNYNYKTTQLKYIHTYK